MFNATSNGITRETPSTPGVVLAVSPDGGTVVISDPVRQIISLVSSAGGVVTTYGGVGQRAVWAPDSQTVYIAAGSQVLVYSTFTGWNNITQLTAPVTDVTVAVPSVGAFFAGATTTARGYCASTTTTTSGGSTTTTNVFYPDAGVVGPVTDRVAATNDGLHVLGATVTPTATFSDLSIVGTTGSPGVPTGACPATSTPTSGLKFNTTPVLTSVIGGITATAITGVVPTSDSTIAFVTYTGTGGVLPTYTPMTVATGKAATGPGTLGSIKLSGTAIAPVAGGIQRG